MSSTALPYSEFGEHYSTNIARRMRAGFMRDTFDTAQALQQVASDSPCHVATDLWRASQSRYSEIVAGKICVEILMTQPEPTASGLWQSVPQSRSREKLQE